MKSKIKVPNKVIIISKGTVGSLGLIRSIGELDCEIFFISLHSESDFSRKSKYVKKSWYAKTELQVIEILNEEFKFETIPPIIISGSDVATTILDSNMKLLAKNFILPNANNFTECAITELMDKIKLNAIAESCGFKVPKSIQIDLDNEDIESIVQELPFKMPCIVKPLLSVLGEKTDNFIANETESLNEYLNKNKGRIKKVIIQEFILKKGEFAVQGISIPQSNEVIIAGISEKKIISEIYIGVTTFGKIIPTHKLINENRIKQMLLKTGYSGVFDLEVMYDEKNVYFIEINFRTSGHNYALTKAGVNLPALWILKVSGKNISNFMQKISKSNIFLNEFVLLKGVGKEISFIKYIKCFLKTDTFLTLNRKDMRPLIAILKNSLKKSKKI